MDLDELLGIDPNDTESQNIQQLMEADERLMDDLIALRKKRGLRQEDLADYLGCSQSAIARIEAADRDPHLSTLRRYALAIKAAVRHEVVPFEELHHHPVVRSSGAESWLSATLISALYERFSEADPWVPDDAKIDTSRGIAYTVPIAR